VTRSGVAAALAAVALLTGPTACTGASSSAPETAPSSSSSGDATGPVDDSSESIDPEAWESAVSEPVEDSVYPEVGDPSVDALHYELVLQWDPDSRTLTGEEELTFLSPGDGDRVQLDLAEDLEVSGVLVDGEEAESEHDGKDLVIHGEFEAGEQYVASITYSGRPQPVPAPTTRRDFTTTGFTVGDDGSVWTMQEPYGAFSWYAVNDQPSDKAFYDFTLRVPSPMTGVANGQLTGDETHNGTHVTNWHLDSKTSSYLVTVAFGDYELTEDESASGVPITYWVPESAAFYTSALGYTPEALRWVEEKLGPYPWSSLGIVVVDSNSGMETQTMITLGDTKYTTSKNVIVHEIVHQWYGDQVTPSDWRDLWMSEGMAMYLEFVWRSEFHRQPLDELMNQAALYERTAREINGPPAEYNPEAFGQIQVYYGPALMWHQIRQRVGEETFWEMVRAWPSVDPDGTSSREEYLPWIEEQTGAELSDLFEGWLFAEESPAFP
jgi:aminopeptidase N